MLVSVQQSVQTPDDQSMVYFRDVLGLETSEAEDELDASLRSEAQELGLCLDESKPITRSSGKTASMDTTLSERVRRSGSICSQSSRSTGLTSYHSDASRKILANGMHGQDYSSHVARRSFAGERSRNFTALANSAQSTPTLPSNASSNPPKKSFRRLRGFSLLGKHRNSSESSVAASGCPHCPKDAASKRRALHTLPCGHRFCAAAMRMKINVQREKGLYPSCCGVPIPGATIQHAMTRVEREDFLDNFAKWEDGASRNASVATEALDSDSLTSVSPERDHSPPRETETMAPTVPAWTFFDTVPELLALQAACEAQCQRFKLWTSQNRAAMEAKHIGAVAALHRSQETALEALLDTHALALADAEDKQVTAESTLREVHDQAYRVNVTALKQQEAYCAGTYSDGQPHGRTITALDRTELDKTRRTRDNMASRQESAINVLRGEQGRRIRARVQRQDKEAADLEVLQEREIDALGRHNVAELEELGTIEKEKKTRLATRWRMQTMILMRRAGIEEEDVEACQGIVVDWDGALNRPPVPEKDARRGATRPRYDSMLADGPAQV